MAIRNERYTYTTNSILGTTRAVLFTVVTCLLLTSASHAQVVASPASANSVDLVWTASGDDGVVGTASVYDIRYSTSVISDGNWASATQASGEPSPQPSGSQESFTVTGLQPATTYYFAIKVADEADNWSPLSNIASATTDDEPDTEVPADVADLATIAVTRTSITVQWTAPGDDGTSGTASQYDLRYATSAINSGNFASATPVSGEPAPTSAGSVQSFTVIGLDEDQTYFFALKTADEVPNWSGVSNSPSGTTVNQAPTVPTNISPDGDTLTPGSSVVLTVANSSDIDGDPLWYSYWIASDAGFSDIVASYSNRPQTAGQTSVTFASGTFQNGQHYYWRARATDGSAVSGFSTATDFYYGSQSSGEPCEAPIAAPVAISPIDSTVVATTQPTFWVTNSPDTSDCPDARTYQFQIYGDPDMATLIRSAVINEGTDSTGYTFSGSLETGRYYWWRVRCDNGTVESPFTVLQAFHTPNIAPPSPILVSPSNGATVSTGAPTLSANTVIDLDGTVPLYYLFEVSESSGFTTSDSSNLVAASSGTVEWQVQSNLSDGQTYYWRVRAFDGIEYSSASQTRSFSVDIAGNNPPSTPVLADPVDNAEVDNVRPTVTILNSADPDSDPITYQFEIIDNGSGLLVARGSNVSEGTGGQTSWTVNDDLDDSTTYRWRARAYDGMEYSSWSGIRRFTVILPDTGQGSNSAPSLPIHVSPADNDVVLGEPIVLVIGNSVDLDGDPLTYNFWVYSDSNLTQQVETQFGVQEGIGGQTELTLGLSPIAGQRYWWCCQANDGFNVGDTTVPTSFSFNTISTGEEDVTAGASTPPPGAEVPNDKPELVALNILAGGENNNYYFQVATDSQFVGMVASSPPVPEQDGLVTCWEVDENLQANETYFWRVRCNDNPFSAVSSFIIIANIKAWPNPVRFSDGQQVTFNLPDQPVDLLIQSISGETIRLMESVSGDVQWDGRNEAGNLVSIGTYLWYASNTDQYGKIVVKP